MEISRSDAGELKRAIACTASSQETVGSKYGIEID